MKIYFVSGFLGSGKTTSIINMSRILMEAGLRVGVITNDQGKYLVDNYFVNASGIPSIEVANGCFCCNYDDFDAHVLDLAENRKPDVIFAESVGSCADIIATVMKPMMEFRRKYSINSCLTAFTDGRLLEARFSDKNLPFSEDVIYIFDKQIEEADILVINKSDLFSETDGNKLTAEAEKRYPGKKILFQSAFSDDNLKAWTAAADSLRELNSLKPSMHIDYDKYASGELKMAWLDKVINMHSDNLDLSRPVSSLFRLIKEKTRSRNMAVGHLKLFIRPAEHPAVKISHTGMDDTEGPFMIPQKLGHSAKIVLNARVETEPDELKKIIGESIQSVSDEYNLRIVSVAENSFRPGIPEPVHRFR